jgi:hypothetical protein
MDGLITEVGKRLAKVDSRAKEHQNINLLFAHLCGISGAFRTMTSSTDTSWIHPLRAGDTYEVVGSNASENDVFLSYFTNEFDMSAETVRSSAVRNNVGSALSRARTRSYVRREDTVAIDTPLTSNGAQLFLSQMAIRNTSEAEAAGEALRLKVVSHILDFLTGPAWMQCINNAMQFGHRLSRSGFPQFTDVRTVGYSPTNLYHLTARTGDAMAILELSNAVFDSYVRFFRLLRNMNVLIKFVKNHDVNVSAFKRILSEREDDARRGARRR